MNYFAIFNQWMLSEWLWSVTFAWTLVPMTVLLTIIMLRVVMRRSLFKALLLACSSLFFAVNIFALYAIGFVSLYLGVETSYVATPLNATLSLALIYAFFQTLFLLVLNIWRPMRVWSVGIVVVMSNLVAALLVYELLPTI